MSAPLKIRKNGLQTLRLRVDDDKPVATIHAADRGGFSATIFDSSPLVTPATRAIARIKERP
ncbi:MAG: hypothetical protein ABI537_07055 [Casimicrobiaceae bacterium]